jgi:SagB-type dehydrogenase family enzyme
MGDGSAARAYHEATKHSWESVRRRARFLDWDNEPRPFKVYEADLPRLELPDPPPTGVPAVAAIGARAGPGPAAPDLTALARLLRLGAGVRRTVRFPGGEEIHFRTYASAGARYPVEVYAACGELEGIGAGLYHFDPSGPALVRLREGDPRGHLVRATAGEEAVARAPVVLALTGIPWRTAWKYTERGYRHLFWDAGTMLANVLALAAASGLPARVVLGFDDADVEALLGVDGRREFPLCLVAVGEGAPVAPAGAPPEPLGLRVRRLSPRELTFEAIAAVHGAGRLGASEVAAWRARPAGPPAGPASLDEPPDPLEEVIARRGSARRFAPGAVPARVLRAVLRLATAGIPTDLAPEGSMPIRPFLIANEVEGAGPGAYAFEEGELRLLRRGEFRAHAGFLCLEQPLGAEAAATHFLLADLDGILAALGDRGYRVAQLAGGIVAGRMYLGAYAHRVGATALTFYDDEVARFLGRAAEGLACMLVVALGRSPRLERPPLSRPARSA